LSGIIKAKENARKGHSLFGGMLAKNVRKVVDLDRDMWYNQMRIFYKNNDWKNDV
jgi:hypothetical protein